MWAEDVDGDEYRDRLAAIEALLPGETIVDDGRGRS